MCEIVVAPDPLGWTVTVAGETCPMAFLGGQAAERAARALARNLSAAGRPVVLTIRLRDGSIAAKIPHLPAAAVSRQALAEAA